MARPVKADSVATRSRVLAAARGAFSDHGIDGVSIRAIAARASVSLATVHHYFGSKESLYRACVDSMYEELISLRGELAKALIAEGTLAERIDRVVRGAFAFARTRKIEMRLLMREVVAAGELPDERRERGQIPFLDEVPALLIAQLGEGRDRTELRLSLQSLSFLIARYAISSDRELELFTQSDNDHALDAVQSHLVRVATAIFQ